MSSCIIQRDNKGKIVRVNTPSGDRSMLFDKIMGLAPVSDMEKAASAMMTVYGDKFKGRFGDWTEASRKGRLRNRLRFRTSSQLFEEYPTWLSGQTTSTGQHSTQITSTVNTYKKIGDFIQSEDMEGKTVLDASSGLGVGTEALRSMGMSVDDVEPYPSSKRTPPTYSKYEDIGKKYDYIVSNAVLNVIPDDWRSDVLKSMADKLKVGGKLFINVRDAKSVSSQKQKIELDDPAEILVTNSKGNIRAYQRGFTRSSLKEYVERELGEGFEVETANPKNSGMPSGMTAVVVTRRSDRHLRFRYVTDGRISMSEGASEALAEGKTDIGMDSGFAHFIDEAGLGDSNNMEWHHVGGRYNRHYFVRLNNGVTLPGARKKYKEHLAEIDRDNIKRILDAHPTAKRGEELFPDGATVMDKMRGHVEVGYAGGSYWYVKKDDRDSSDPKKYRFIGERFDPTKESESLDRFELASGSTINVVSREDIRSIGLDSISERAAMESKGWYDTETDTVTIVVDNIESKEDMESTIMHEVIAHKGLRGLLGNKFNDTMSEIFDSMDADIRDTYLARYGDKVTAAEEFMATMAESKGAYEIGFWDKVITAIRDALRSMGINLKMTDNDMKALLTRSKNNLSEMDKELMKSVNTPNRNLTYPSAEPRLFFRSDTGKVYDTYAKAMRASSGGQVRVGFLAGSVEESEAPSGTTDITFSGTDITLSNDEAFIPVLGVSSRSDTGSRVGFVNYLTKKGLLSGERERIGDKYYLTGAGHSSGLRIFNAVNAAEKLRFRFGNDSAKTNYMGSVDFDTEVNDDATILTDTEGRKVSLSRSDIKSMLRQGRFEELRKKYPGFESFVASVLMEDMSGTGATRDMMLSEKRRDLKNRSDLISILSTLGIRVMGIHEYMEKYKTRNGIEPSARALSDMANKVIALAEGATIEDLQEEVAHFLVDTYRNQAEIDEVLDTVEGTDMWNRYASRYYEVYGREYKGEELDRMVRREILGKILADRFNSTAERGAEALASSEDTCLSLLGRIIQSIRNFFTTQRSDLDKVLDRIRESALANDPSVFDVALLDGSDHLMYSLSDKEVANKLVGYGRSLDRLYRRLNKMRVAQGKRIGESLSMLRDIDEELRKVGGALNKNNVMLSTRSVISTAMAEVEYLVTVSKAMRRDKGNLDYETIQVIDNVYQEIVPLIRNLRGFVNNQGQDYYGGSRKGMVDDMDNILSLAETSMSDINAMRYEKSDKWIESQLKMFNVNQRYWPRIKEMVNSVMKDISAVSRWMGTLEHSSNTILNMLGQRMGIARQEGRSEGEAKIHKMTLLAQRLGWKIGDSRKLIQTNPDGTLSDYIESGRDNARYDLNYRTEQANAIIDIYGMDKGGGRDRASLIKDMLSDKGLRIKVRDEVVGYDEAGNEIVKPVYHTFKARQKGFDMSAMTAEDQRKYDKRMSDFQRKNDEMPMTDEYYEKVDKVREKVEKKLGREMSAATNDFLSGIRASRYMILSRFKGEDGKVDMRRFAADPIARREYMDVNRDRAVAKSKMYADGSIKDPASEAGMMAEEIEAWDTAWAEEFPRGDDRKVTSEFMDLLREVEMTEGGDAAFEFMIAGGYLGFSKDMWGSESENGFFEDLMDKIEESGLTDTQQEALDEARSVIGQDTEELRRLLLEYRDGTVSGEYDVDRLLSSSRLSRINELYDNLATAKSAVYSLADTVGVDPGSMSDEVENTVSQSYINALKDAMDSEPGLTELDFAKRYMSERARRQVDTMGRKLRSPSARFGRMETRFLVARYGRDFRKGLRSDLARGMADEILMEYAKTRMRPYMRRYAPKGYDMFVERIKAGQIKATEVMRAIQDNIGKEESERLFGFDINMLDIRLNSRWLEDSDNDYRNPNYDPDLGYGANIPKMSIYRDNRFFDKYGIKNEGDEATINKDQWEMRKLFLEQAREAKSDYGEGQMNIYMRPQISKQDTERLAKIGSDPMGVLSNTFKDIVSERVDDPVHGQGQIADEDVDGRYRMIPKYYINRLENRDDVSDDLVYGYAMLSMQSSMYKSKKKALGDVMNYKNMLLNSSMEGGKNPEGSHAYKMFVDWVNANIYDVRVNNKSMEWNIGGYKVDLNKLALSFTKIVSVTNLGFNPKLAVTGAMTGQTNFLLEGIAGQYISKDSMRFGYEESRRQMSSYIDGIGNINRDNKLYVVGETLGVFNVRNRVGSAGYNKFFRTVTRDLPFKMLEILNSPLDPQIITSVMDDTRLYDGEFWSWGNFKQMMMEDRNLSAREAEMEWRRLKDKTIWEMISIKDGKIVAKDPSNSALIDNYIPSLSSRVRSMSQICNGTLNEENRIGASRNVLFNMILPHRGWFIIAAQRLWKKEGFNFQTMQMEKGYDRSLISLMNKVYKGMSEGRMSGLFDVVREEYDKMSYTEQLGVRRSLLNYAMLATLMVIGRGLSGFGDDDDNEDSWAVQFGLYAIYSWINEMASQTSPFMEMNAVDMIQDPIVVARKLKDILTISNWSPLDDVQSGVYKGESKLWRQLMKLSFGKQWYNYSSARNIKQTSDYWRMMNRMTMDFFLGGRKDEKDEVEDGFWY